MRPHTAALLAVAGALATGLVAYADLSVELASKDKVLGSISPEEIETFLVDVPAGSKISAKARGLKSAEAGKPALTLDIRDAADALIATSGPRTRTKASAKAKVADTGRYHVILTSADTGDYELVVQWRSPKRKKQKVDLLDTPDEQAVMFDGEVGGTIKIKVKPVRGSAANPRFDRLDGPVGTLDLPDPAPGEKGQVIESVTVSEFGQQQLWVANDASAGSATAVVKIKPPTPMKRSVDVSDETIDPTDEESEGIGAIITPAGGVITVAGGGASTIGGAGVDIPPGALTSAAIIVVSTAPAMAGDRPVGPTIHLGPDGLSFSVPVRVIIPFNPALFAGGDYDGLQVYTRDVNGNASLVPGPYDFDPVAGTVSIRVSHFSGFRAFDRGSVGGAEPIVPGAFDLNADGLDDLVIPASAAGDNNEGALFIFFAPLPTTPKTATTANRVIVGVAAGENLGIEHTFGDVDGNGVADLIVRSEAYSGGAISIFRGATNFGATTSAHADDTILGDGDADFFGTGVAVGDVNDDNLPDLIVGAEGASNFAGKVYVFLGDGTGHFAADATDADIVLTGSAENDEFGGDVASGDVNNDGIDDIIVGAYQVGTPGPTGKVYVFFGDAGLASQAASAANVTITGPTAGDGFGYRVAVGDVTGDGIDDIVASNGASPYGNVATGDVFVFTGGASLAGGGANTIAFRKYTGASGTAQLGADIRLAQMSNTHDRLSILAMAPGHLSGAGGLWLLSAADGTLPISGTVSATANVVGQTTSDAFRFLLDPLQKPTGATVFAAAPWFGTEDQGRVYGFATLPTGGPVANDAASVLITGASGQRIGGDVPE